MYHDRTYRLLNLSPPIVREGDTLVRLPASVVEWYSNPNAAEILAKYSNDDHPIPPQDFKAISRGSKRLLPFEFENQGVCTWAVVLDAGDDPPVFVDPDASEKAWVRAADSFSDFVYGQVWAHACVLLQPHLAFAVNEPLSSHGLARLEAECKRLVTTHGWPTDDILRFEGKGFGVLIHSAPAQADWYLGAPDESGLSRAIALVGDIDGVGHNLEVITRTGS